MKFLTKSSSLKTLKGDCLIVTIYANKTLSEAATEVDAQTQAIQAAKKLDDVKFKTGQCSWISLPGEQPYKRLLAVCVGDSADKTDSQSLRKASDAAVRALKSKCVKHAIWSVENTSELNDEKYAAIIAESFITQTYTYTETKTQNIEKTDLGKLTLHSLQRLSGGWKKGLLNGNATGNGINLARELGNLPANICTPTYLAKKAQTFKSPKVKVRVLEEAQMKRLGMGSLLSVAAGSDQPAKFIIIDYKGAATNKKPYVLVGKGITFDTGGISLKPGIAMDEMKFDMCGAASVFGTMQAIIELQPKINVVALVAATENMPNGNATKPGDVVTSMSGQTIEVLNTDAEGRLVLCDALTYAERYKPSAVIDIATLTGACVIALGKHASGLYANDQDLANELLQAGQNAQDKAWQMPLWDEYQKQLDSNFADIANIGGREAGSVTAASFLARFTKAYKWAHLDIAGTAWNSGGAKGATGRPVGLLVDYLLSRR